MDDKIYFQPGDLVVLNKELPNAPIMMVVRKELSAFKHMNNNEAILRGIRCRWFTKDGLLQEAVFNTKDIKILK